MSSKRASIRKGEHDKAIAEGERAVNLAPRLAQAHSSYGNSLRYAGRPEEAILLFQKANRLNPFGPSSLYRDLPTSVPVGVIERKQEEKKILSAKKRLRQKISEKWE